MQTEIPSAAQVRAALEALSYAQLRELQRLSGLGFNTLWKVRSGKTASPGIETVRKLLPHLKAASKYAPQKAAA